MVVAVAAAAAAAAAGTAAAAAASVAAAVGGRGWGWVGRGRVGRGGSGRWTAAAAAGKELRRRTPLERCAAEALGISSGVPLSHGGAGGGDRRRWERGVSNLGIPSKTPL